MGFLYGRETEDGYEPSTLHRWLKPGIRGNTINGLGEKRRRQPTPVYHRRSHWHPYYLVQESFYARQYWDLIQAAPMLKSWWMDRIGFAPVAAEQQDGTPEAWTRRVKEKALEHPEADIVGITEITPEMIFDVDAEKRAVTEKYAVLIGRRMDYDKLASNLRKDPPGKRVPFWRNRFLPTVHEVLWTYTRSQGAAWALANWIRGRGHHAKGMGGPKGSSLTTLHAAWSAGLGQLGKHGSLINDELGSSFRFSYVLTDLPLVPDEPRDFGVDDFCTSCQLCYRECPPKAISNEKQIVRGIEKWYVDFDKCMPYFNENYGCAICLSVCPWSRPGVAPKLAQKMLRRRARKDRETAADSLE